MENTKLSELYDLEYRHAILATELETIQALLIDKKIFTQNEFDKMFNILKSSLNREFSDLEFAKRLFAISEVKKYTDEDVKFFEEYEKINPDFDKESVSDILHICKKVDSVE